MGLTGWWKEDEPSTKKPKHPEVLLHYFAQDEASIARKMDYYDRMHRHHEHPMDRCGPLKKIPEEVI